MKTKIEAILPVLTLWQREMTRFYRDRSRVIGGMLPPVIFWFFIGSGLGNSFNAGDSSNINYLQYFFPGTLTLIFLFTSVFSTISIIEDRREGFLQSVLAAPVSRSAIVLGKLLGSSSLAFLQGLPFLLLAPLAGIHIHIDSVVILTIILFGIAFSLSGVGFIIAWMLDSTQGFHAIMNMVLIPMWLLSGALFPTHNIPLWLSWLIKINPLTYCVAGLQRQLLGDQLIQGLPRIELCLLVIFIFCLTTFTLAILITKTRNHR